MTILLDRLSGIAGLAILAPIGALFSYRLGILTPALMPVLYAVCLLSLAIGSFFFLALSPRLYHSGIFQKLMGFLPFKEHWHRAYSAVFAYRHRLDKLFGAFLLTLVSQSAFTLNFYFAAVQVGGIDLPLSLFFFLVPLGMLVTAVPLFRGGIGIGQAAFLQLFYWAGATGTTSGLIEAKTAGDVFTDRLNLYTQPTAGYVTLVF